MGEVASDTENRCGQLGESSRSNVRRCSDVRNEESCVGQSGESCIDKRMLWVGASSHAQEDIRVDQTRGNSHLVVVPANPFP